MMWNIPGIVSLEPNNEVSFWIGHHGVSPHRDSREVSHSDIACVVVTGTVGAAGDDLEIVTVQMERMLSRVVVVQDNVHNLIFVKDESIGVRAINAYIGSICSSGKDGIQSWNLWSDVRDIVKERAECSCQSAEVNERL